jgi:hypothetical protein
VRLAAADLRVPLALDLFFFVAMKRHTTPYGLRLS